MIQLGRSLVCRMVRRKRLLLHVMRRLPCLIGGSKMTNGMLKYIGYRALREGWG